MTVYQDENLKSKCFRISEKKELQHIKDFIKLLRSEHREKAIKFIEDLKRWT